MNSKALRTILVTFLVLAVMGLLLVRECAYGAGMGATYKTCQCAGYEWELYDQTAADGPRKTLCIGMIESVTCLQSMGGPEVPCGE